MVRGVNLDFIYKDFVVNWEIRYRNEKVIIK